MFRCVICGTYFDRGTTLKSNNYCDDCLDKYVKVQVVEYTPEEIIDWYTDVMENCNKENESCYEAIKKNNELIEFSKEQIVLAQKTLSK